MIQHPDAGAIRILVVEDERIVALDLRNALRDLGFVVLGISASEAEACEQGLPLRPAAEVEPAVPRSQPQHPHHQGLLEPVRPELPARALTDLLEHKDPSGGELGHAVGQQLLLRRIRHEIQYVQDGHGLRRRQLRLRRVGDPELQVAESAGGGELLGELYLVAVQIEADHPARRTEPA